MAYLGSPSGLATAPAWVREVDQPGATWRRRRTAGDAATATGTDGSWARPASTPRADEGRAFLYLGSATGLSIEPAWSMYGGDEGGAFGSSVGTAGDVNGDGFSTFVAGAPSVEPLQLRRRGPRLRLPGLGLNHLPRVAAWSKVRRTGHGALRDLGGDRGRSNGDGFADLIVGAPRLRQRSQRGGPCLRLPRVRGRPGERVRAWTAEVDQTIARFGTLGGDRRGRERRRLRRRHRGSPGRWWGRNGAMPSCTTLAPRWGCLFRRVHRGRGIAARDRSTASPWERQGTSTATATPERDHRGSPSTSTCWADGAGHRPRQRVLRLRHGRQRLAAGPRTTPVFRERVRRRGGDRR